MSDQPPTPQLQTETVTSTQKPQRTSRKPRTIGRWVIVLLLLVIIGMGVQQLAAVRFWETLDNEAGQIATVDGRLAALEAAVADQNRLRDDIRQMQESLQQERALLSLDRVEQQIDAGWQIWVGTGDPKILMVTLEKAQRSLANQTDAAAQALRLALGQDLSTLKSQQTVDLRAAIESIDAVIASIDRLPLIQDRRVLKVETGVTASPKVEAPAAATLLEQSRQIATELADELWQTIRGMIRVQRLDHAEAALIAPEQKVFLQQGLRLLLLDARHALIQRNTPVYQQTLAQARAWIVKYTDGADALVREDLAALQRLLTINIDPSAVSLDHTRQALAAARAALTREPVVAASAPAPAATEQPKTDESLKTQETGKGAPQ
ncbi:MAG: uroporphyrinogen-III C-methyltransferase [Fluviibacter sp.]|jgi:uncharacterized protein HemX